MDTLDPIRDTQLISPVDTRQLSSANIRQLYADESLTQDEYMVLDFIGHLVSLKEGGIVEISFQGLKRLTDIHQAKLTKAINRLVEKGLLIKGETGYSLTPEGMECFARLVNNFRHHDKILPTNVYSHIAQGQIQGLDMTEKDYQQIAEALVGKWFGSFRFTSKTLYADSIELGWVSTNGSISAALILGPENAIRLTISASIYDESVSYLQILMNQVSQAIETAIDAPTIFTSQRVFENSRDISEEMEYAVIGYAG
ncbi:MAG: hypothetical protein ACXAE3_00755 [Candidatus Kariarchaeaceae archaeon]|jgi:DNA-binding MarR family transcriptional regulator